jgi:hypothetical protein
MTYPGGSRYLLAKNMAADAEWWAPDCLAGTTFLSAACSDVGSARVITHTSVPPLTGFVSSSLSVAHSPGTGAVAAGTYTLTAMDDEILQATTFVSAQLKFYALV